jgi:hemoglobin
MANTLPVRPARDDETAPMTARVNVFELAGGQPFFDALVDRFYQGVESDSELLAIYPDQGDLQGARRRLALFLGQYWGGPTTYSDGGVTSPFMRHRGFPIDPAARSLASLHAEAVVHGSPAPVCRLLAYFDTGAEAMQEPGRRSSSGLSVLEIPMQQGGREAHDSSAPTYTAGTLKPQRTGREVDPTPPCGLPQRTSRAALSGCRSP